MHRSTCKVELRDYAVRQSMRNDQMHRSTCKVELRDYAVRQSMRSMDDQTVMLVSAGYKIQRLVGTGVRGISH